MKPLAFLLFLLPLFSIAQQNDIDYDAAIDSLVSTTPGIYRCQKNGKDDTRYLTKTPEKYSNYQPVFYQYVDSFIHFSKTSHFFCDVEVEINCKGEAGNYLLSIEPRLFHAEDFEYFKQLIALIESLRNYKFKPAYYLGEDVNSRVKFRLYADKGKVRIK